MKVIDLSHPINMQTPVYPGDPAARIEVAGKIEKNGYNDHYVSLGTHIGTHIDAPAHMIQGGKTLDEFPMRHFVGQAKCIDISNGNVEAIKSADIKHGDIVLLYTNMDKKYHDSSYFEDYPVINQEDADFLVQTGVKMVGFDTCSADNLDGFPIHKTLLKSDVLIIENLSNLDQLVGKDFTLYALPLKLEIDGAPARVIAEINE